MLWFLAAYILGYLILVFFRWVGVGLFLIGVIVLWSMLFSKNPHPWWVWNTSVFDLLIKKFIASVKKEYSTWKAYCRNRACKNECTDIVSKSTQSSGL